MVMTQVSAIGGISALAVFIPLMIGILIASIVLLGYPLYVIAQKQGHPSPWWAFVPIVQAVLFMQLGDQNPWLLLLALIPILGALIILVLSLIAWMRIAEKQGFPGWYGLLTLVPLVGIAVPFYLALASPTQQINRN